LAFHLKVEATRSLEDTKERTRSFRLQAEAKHLQISGTRFLASDGTPFRWRGITAFRLLEFVAKHAPQAATA